MDIKLGGMIENTLVKAASRIFGAVGMRLVQDSTSQIPQLLEKGLLKDSAFKTTHGKALAKDISEVMAKGGKDSVDMTQALMDVVMLRISKVQFEQSSKVNVSDSTPGMMDSFNAQAIAADINLIIGIVSVVLEVVSVGQYDQIGPQLYNYLNVSGLNSYGGQCQAIMVDAAMRPKLECEVWLQTRPQLHDPTTLSKLRFYALLDDRSINEELALQGWSDTRINHLLNTSWFYPNAQDFIRFGLREVFREDVVAKYGYDENNPIDELVPREQIPDWHGAKALQAPPRMSDLAKAAGLDPNVFRWYWRAHWELPSPQQGFEMLHRGLIDTEELTQLLRILDLAPGWIDKMVGISYSPYTRVDARNMFITGVLTEEEFIQANMDIGYPRDKAERMAQWVKSTKMSVEKDLTQTVIFDAYDKGLKTRQWALDSLVTLGYDSTEADLMLAVRETKATQVALDDQTGLLTKQLTLGLLTEEIFTAELNKLALTEQAKAKLLAKARIIKAEKISLPSQSDLLRWYSKKMISATEARAKLSLLGYLSADIDNYLSESAPIE